MNIHIVKTKVSRYTDETLETIIHDVTLLYFQASVDKTTNSTGDISRLVDDLSNNHVLFYLFQASVD